EDGPTTYRFADPNAPPPQEEPAPAAAEAKLDDELEVVGDVEPEEVTETEEPDENSPEYFIAAYPPGTSLRQPKTFRLYPYRDELLVLHAGPFAWRQVDLLADRPGVPDTERKKIREEGALGSGMVTDAGQVIRNGRA